LFTKDIVEHHLPRVNKSRYPMIQYEISAYKHLYNIHKTTFPV